MIVFIFLAYMTALASGDWLAAWWIFCAIVIYALRKMSE